MRWLGPGDPAGLAAIRQAEAAEIVTALHQIPNGAAWPDAVIAKRRQKIELAGPERKVVEGLPVDEAIQTRELVSAERIVARILFEGEIAAVAATMIDEVTLAELDATLRKMASCPLASA